MRSKDPELMNKIRLFIDQYYSEMHHTPSCGDIAKGLGIARTTAYRYLLEMDANGMLRYDGQKRKIETSMISKFTTGTAACPVVGSIPCGSPETEEENILEYVNLPTAIFGNGEFYILKASGDSMVDAGIDNGDLVVIRKTADAEVGNNVVALDGDGQNTLKRLGSVDPKTREAVLLYCNESHYPGKEIRVRNLMVQGVAEWVIRKL